MLVRMEDRADPRSARGAFLPLELKRFQRLTSRAVYHGRRPKVVCPSSPVSSGQACPCPQPRKGPPSCRLSIAIMVITPPAGSPRRILARTWSTTFKESTIGLDHPRGARCKRTSSRKACIDHRRGLRKRIALLVHRLLRPQPSPLPQPSCGIGFSALRRSNAHIVPLGLRATRHRHWSPSNLRGAIQSSPHALSGRGPARASRGPEQYPQRRSRAAITAASVDGE